MPARDAQETPDARKLRELTRMAHEATKALREAQKDVLATIKQAEAEKERLEAGFRLLAEDKVHEAVTAAVADMNEKLIDHVAHQAKVIRTAIEKSVNQVVFGNTQGRGESTIRMIDRRIGELFSEMEIITIALTQMRTDMAAMGHPVPNRNGPTEGILRERLEQSAKRAWGKGWQDE